MAKARQLEARSPDFFCIGAQKAGTTWLHANLKDHPGVWLPPLKELQYFNQLHIPGHRGWTQGHRDAHMTQRLRTYIRNNEELNLFYVRMLAFMTNPDVDDDWYRLAFSFAGPDRICGDMTPEYSLLPDEGIEHLLRVAPEAKIIFMMRDPIDRCWSHLRMFAKRKEADQITLDQLIALPEVTVRADYPAILARWRRFVPEERLFTGFFDQIRETPEPFLKDLLAFLGRDHRPEYFAKADEAVHKGISMAIPDDIYDHLRGELAPVYEELKVQFPDETSGWYDRHYG